MNSGQLQMQVFSALVALLTVVGLAYIFIAQPDYLRATRHGVPYLTPPVENPVTGESVSVNELAEHFKGNQ
jgi:hypothetical protein